MSYTVYVDGEKYELENSLVVEQARYELLLTLTWNIFKQFFSNNFALSCNY